MPGVQLPERQLMGDDFAVKALDARGRRTTTHEEERGLSRCLIEVLQIGQSARADVEAPLDPHTELQASDTQLVGPGVRSLLHEAKANQAVQNPMGRCLVETC
jgi:hypothetical protein